MVGCGVGFDLFAEFSFSLLGFRDLLGGEFPGDSVKKVRDGAVVGYAVPGVGLDEVLVYALPFVVGGPKPDLRLWVSLLSGFPEPVNRFGVVLVVLVYAFR